MKTLGAILFVGSFGFHFWIDNKVKDPGLGGTYRFKDLAAYRLAADPEVGLQGYCQHIARYNFLSGIARGMTISGFLIVVFAYA